jgi:hypothetical protein
MALDSGKITWNQLGAIKLCTVSISAKVVDENGKLGPVTFIEQKNEALTQEVTSSEVKILILANQDDENEPVNDNLIPGLQIHHADSLSAAINFIYEDDITRQIPREKAIHEFRNRKPSGLRRSSHVKVEALYQPLSLLSPDSDDIPDESVAFYPDPNYSHPNQSGLWDESDQEEGPRCKVISLEELMAPVRKEGELPLRLVILGQNGSGKTDFLYHAAWQVAQDQFKCNKRNLIPVEIDLAKWEEWATTQPQELKSDLPASLSDIFYDKPLVSKEVWLSWMNNGDIIFFIDNLHSIEFLSFLDIYQKAARQMHECMIIVACRTANFEQYRQEFEEYNIVYLKPLTDDQRSKYVKVYFGSLAEDHLVEPMLDLIRYLPELDRSCSNPRLLSILCLGIHDNGYRKTSSQMYYRLTDIFEDIVTNLLGAAPSLSGSRVHVAGWCQSYNKRRVLERLALDAQLQGLVAGAPIPRDIVLASLRESLVDEGMCENRATSQASVEVLGDLEQNSGFLLQHRGQNAEYRFLHNLIQQYLTACRIKYLVEKSALPNWDYLLSTPSRKITCRELVYRLSWQPRQQETLGFLTGKLKEPLDFLMMLIDPANDDIFLHRRALALWCFLEVDPKHLDKMLALLKNLTDDVISMWFDSQDVIKEDYFRRAVLASVKMNAPFQGKHLDSYLVEQLRNPNGKGERLMETLSMLSSRPLSSVLSQNIGRMLNDTGTRSHVNSELHRFALEVAKKLGPSAATPDILRYLSASLYSSIDPFVELQVLSAMGSEASKQPDMIVKLADILEYDLMHKSNEKNSEARFLISLETIRRLKIAQNPKILPILRLILMNKSDNKEQERARCAGALAETPIDDLAESDLTLLMQEIQEFIFHGSNGYIRILGRKAASRAFQSSQKKHIHDTMTGWFERYNRRQPPFMTKEEFSFFFGRVHNIFTKGILDDTQPLLQSVETLSRQQLELTVGNDQVIQDLIRGIWSKNDILRKTSQEIFRRLAPIPKDPSNIILEVNEVYRTSKGETCCVAVTILGYFGKFAAREEVFNSIQSKLKFSKNDRVLQETASALKCLGSPASFQPGLLKALALRLTTPIFKPSEETKRCLASVLAELISSAGVNTDLSTRPGHPLHALIDPMMAFGDHPFPAEISIWHNRGLRFFLGARHNEIVIKYVKELCNIS